LVLNGAGPPTLDAPANNVCFPASCAPGYAPPGQSLASVTVVGLPDADDDAVAAACLAQLGAWFGPNYSTQGWRFLGAFRVPYAQPAQQLPASNAAGAAAARDFTTRPERLPGLFVCGDHCATPTLNGALESGRAASDAVLKKYTRRGAALFVDRPSIAA
jgi:hypothetical protein